MKLQIIVDVTSEKLTALIEFLTQVRDANLKLEERETLKLHRRSCACVVTGGSAPCSCAGVES